MSDMLAATLLLLAEPSILLISCTFQGETIQPATIADEAGLVRQAAGSLSLHPALAPALQTSCGWRWRRRCAAPPRAATSLRRRCMRWRRRTSCRSEAGGQCDWRGVVVPACSACGWLCRVEVWPGPGGCPGRGGTAAPVRVCALNSCPHAPPDPHPLLSHHSTATAGASWRPPFGAASQSCWC